VTDEVWQPVRDFEGIYEVSNMGRVRSLTRKIIARGSSRVAHILVCEAFHGPKPEPHHEVRHLNGNGQDNRPENLAWGTKSENRADAVRHGTDYNTKKTKCPQGHEYDMFSPGRRECSKCRREHSREYHLKQWGRQRKQDDRRAS
jgi:hypothetical protein